MSIFSKIKNLFKKEEVINEVESIDIVDEPIEKPKVELSGSLKFPKKIGKAEMDIKQKVIEEVKKEVEVKKSVNNFISRNEFFKEKASSGKRQYNKNTRKRDYNRNNKGK